MSVDPSTNPASVETAPDERLAQALDVLTQIGNGEGSPEAMAEALPRELPECFRAAGKGSFARALTSLLILPEPIPMLETLARAGVFASLLPEVEALRHMHPDTGRHKDIWRHTLLVVARIPADPISRLAALLHDIGKPPTKTVERGGVHFPGHAEIGADMARRRMRILGFPPDTVDAVVLLTALHLRINSYEDEWTDAAARRLARDAGGQFDRLLQLSRADVTSARREMVERALRRVDLLEERVRTLREEEENRPVSPLDGNALMAAFARPPGRWIGQIKGRLEALVADGALAPDDHEEAWRIARAMVGQGE